MRSNSKTTRTPSPNAETFFSRRLVACVLLILFYTQSIAPPALASAASRPKSGGAVAGPVRAESGAAAATAQVVQVPASQGYGIVLSPLATAFDGVVGFDYHQPTAKLVVSVNSPTGIPNNFELIEADGAHRAFSNLTGLSGELKIAAVRDDDGRGLSLGGFRAGEVLTGTGAAGVIARVEPDGSRVQPQWVTLPDESGLPSGLHLDRTGVFAGDLIAVTTAGNVWRVKSSGTATKVAELGTPLSGVVTIPADADKYGPWAGKILAGAKAQGRVYAVDAQGAAASYDLGLQPEDLRVTPAHENFYAVDPGEGKVWGAQAAAFAEMVGDVLVAQESPGRLARVRWNGAEFEVGQLASTAQLKQIAFAPAGVAPVPGVRQVYEKIAYGSDLISQRQLINSQWAVSYYVYDGHGSRPLPHRLRGFNHRHLHVRRLRHAHLADGHDAERVPLRGRAVRCGDGHVPPAGAVHAARDRPVLVDGQPRGRE